MELLTADEGWPMDICQLRRQGCRRVARVTVGKSLALQTGHRFRNVLETAFELLLGGRRLSSGKRCLSLSLNP
jgi:hypothetical protein